MLRKVLDFIRSRPTEVWLGLWAAVVAVLAGTSLEIPPGVATAVSAVIGWIVTFVASRPSNELGPTPPSE